MKLCGTICNSYTKSHSASTIYNQTSIIKKKQLLKFLKILNSKIIIGFVFFFFNFETLATIKYVTYFNVVLFFIFCAELLILM